MHNLSVKSMGILLTVLAYSVSAIGDVCVKSSSEALNVLSVALYVNIFTTAFLLPVIFMTGGLKHSLRTTTLKAHFIRSMLMLLNFLCVIYAIGKLPIPSFYVIVFMIPFIINIISFLLLKEKISLYRWIAIGFAFSGILVALRPDSIPLTTATIIAFISVFLSSSATISVKFINKSDHWLSYTLYMMIFQTPTIVVIMLWQGISLLPPQDITLLIWLMGGGLAYAVALSLIPQAIQRIDASLVGSILYIVFPWGLFYGYFVFGDTIDLWTALGAVIIITSGLFLIYRERKEHSKLLEMEENVTVSKR